MLELANEQTLDIERRRDLCNLAIDKIQFLPSDSAKRIVLFKIANRYYNGKDKAKYRSVVQELLVSAVNEQDSAHTAKAYRYLGDYFDFYTRHRDSAFFYYSKAEKLYRRMSEHGKLSEVLMLKTNILLKEKNYFECEATAFQLLSISKKNKNWKGIYEALVFISIVASELQDFDRALLYLREAKEVVDEHDFGDVNAKETLLNNIGSNYQFLGDQDLAIMYFLQAMQTKDLKATNPLLFAVLLDNIAYSNFKLGNNKEVEELFLLSIDIKDSLSIQNESIFSIGRLSDFYLATGDSLKAKKLLCGSMVNLESERAVDQLPLLERLLVVDRNIPTEMAKQYIFLRDSLQLAERQDHNKFAQIRFETDEIVTAKDIAVKQKWIITAVALIVVLILSLLIMLQIHRAKQNELAAIHNRQKADEEIYKLMLEQQSRIDESRQREKLRIAKDLHDGIMNKLASTRLNLFILNKRTDPETIRRCLPFVADIQNIEREIRNIAHDLNSDVFNSQDSFKNLILSLLDEQKNCSDAHCHFEIDERFNWEVISNPVKVHIYRILQEAFQNINKHAQARNIMLGVSSDMHFIKIQVSDDGFGFNLAENIDGIGLKNMRARANEIVGQLQILSSIGVGTNLILRIPI
ncbi:MAG TPA: histidine kinase [Flavobacterium sp.]